MSKKTNPLVLAHDTGVYLMPASSARHMAGKLTPTQFYKAMREDGFPLPVETSAGPRWRSDSVMEWINSRPEIFLGGKRS